MRIKGLFFVCSYFLFLQVTAQSRDTVVQASPVKEVATSNDSHSYLKKGYYDRIATMTELPKVDSAAFSTMEAKYQGEDFQYDTANPDEESLFQRAMRRIKNWLSSLMPDMGYFEASDAFYKLLGVVAIVVFVLILYRALFSGKRLLAPDEEENDPESTIRFIEKNLLDVNLEHYIQQADKEGDYALAIRYLNLLNIQLLARKEYINWRPSKTNMELILEIKDPEMRKDFESNTRIFDTVWFGGEPTSEEQYTAYRPYFSQFQTRWK
ncbi:DUF4129 domain-containing protein [Sphingobacterium psychroaquaticum]|uniref:DUF4129 domain-containing protein n=1 Tax=Sphingobacterium psychroaquaticum TaxID=561061 RepID=UPI00106D5693|nr:DUF4129 domain-containing protein [Sphingobacterium psychroaquaticum]QBQ42711.1 DUF4129 domain-containing protein [Sphingobacterium psychroaquaticum]